MNTRRLTHPAPALALAGLTAVLVAACGGSGKPPSPSLPRHGSQSSGVQSAYHYADCMRRHGVTSFQDPKVSSHGNSTSVSLHVDPQITGSPAFESAQRACAHILPEPTNGPTQAQLRAHTDAILAFAKCMRQHGFPRFPDPNSQGQLPPSALVRAGIDLQQPAIKTAAYACVPVTHGVITRADIDQAIASPDGGSQNPSAGG